MVIISVMLMTQIQGLIVGGVIILVTLATQVPEIAGLLGIIISVILPRQTYTELNWLVCPS